MTPKRRNKSGAIGAYTETAVVRYLKANGWPYAERRRLKGRHDEGDITGCPGLVWEVKGGNAAKYASDALIREWLGDTEIERQNAGADIGILVVHRPGVGATNAGRWWAIVPYVTAYCLHTGDDVHVQPGAWDTLAAIPVRLRLGDLVDLLRHAGFGSPYGQVTP